MIIKNTIIITILILNGCAGAPEKKDLKAEVLAEQARITQLQARAAEEEEVRKKQELLKKQQQQQLEKLEAMRKQNPKLEKKLAKWEKTTYNGRLVVTLFDVDKRDIKILAKFIKQHPNLKISVEGYTDNKGNRQHNLGLSERRATSVKFSLMEHGIASTRITAKGLGESRPIASNKNRRVEIIIHRAN
jgi:outer membrane protein OmpA-like peptidoglycan-associated protein